MRRIGVDQDFGEVYGSVGNYWRIILPSPILTGALLDPPLPIDHASQRNMPYLFREDQFDPVARIRRGRFYVPAAGQRPASHRVLPRLAGDSIEGAFDKFLFVYDDYQISPQETPPKLVALGTPGFPFSLCRVAAPPERISTGEFMFVLRARHNLGILPDIDRSALPDTGVAKLIEELEKFADAAQRESPDSIIDRARAAAQCCLGVWLTERCSDAKWLQEDLGPLIRRVENEKRSSARAAELVGLLHSRAKPNEQERYGGRPPMEDDAELAVKAIGFLIREFGWALD